MKWLHGFVALLGALLLSGSAQAQSTAVQAAIGYNSLVGCPSGVTVCFVPYGAFSSLQSASAESSHVFKATAGNLYDLYVTIGATAGFLMVFDAASAPTDGAVTPKDCIQVPASTTQSLFTGGTGPEVYSTGIVAVFSTTGCFTKTASATAFFHARVQ